ncbi:MAG TPA: Clp1/GlmU family protein [Actinomycetota bacterium]|nr:Clp1/GlmU family protein [Actinomycetota bacterium]
MKPEIEAAYERLIGSPGTVVLLGGIDAGKTSFGIGLLRRANEAGVPAAFVDADIDQSSVGPPTTIGLRLTTGLQEIDHDTLREADSLAFVGSLTPREHLLPIVSGTGKLIRKARQAGCRLVVVDTTSFVSGIYGQTLNYFLMDSADPDFVVAFERGGELEPLVGIAHRFTPAEVIELHVQTDAVRSAEEKVSFRERQFAAYFEHTSRWRVKPTVFMPTLPPGFDLHLLDGLVVGMEDGKGACVGIGVLEHDPEEDILRMVSPVTEGVKGLRLGSVRMHIGGHSRGPVHLRDLFGTE